MYALSYHVAGLCVPIYTATTEVRYSYQIATGIIPISILVSFHAVAILYEYHTLLFVV